MAPVTLTWLLTKREDLPRVSGPHELATRYGLSDELASRLSAIDAITDAVIEP